MDRLYFLLLIQTVVWSILLASKSAIARQTIINNNALAIVGCNSSKLNEIKTKAGLKSDRIAQQDINSDLPQASIWWAAEQFDPFSGNLIQNWLTNPQKQQINLTVNWQLWTLLDYFGRYRFVNQFGTVVRKYGYSLNIFNQKKQCLATYQYNSVSNPPKWELHLETIGRDSLELESSEAEVVE